MRRGTSTREGLLRRKGFHPGGWGKVELAAQMALGQEGWLGGEGRTVSSHRPAVSEGWGWGFGRCRIVCFGREL